MSGKVWQAKKELLFRIWQQFCEPQTWAGEGNKMLKACQWDTAVCQTPQIIK